MTLISLHARPERCAAIEAFPLDDQLVLYNSQSGEAFVLNRTAALVWPSCDGTHSLALLAQGLAASEKIAPDLALADVTELIGELERASIIALR